MLIMADASDTEEGLLIDGAGGATRLIMAFNALGELLVMSRSGGGIVSDHLFSGPCFSLASARAKSILSYIQKSVSRT